MLVLHQIPGGIRQFGVPQMQTESIKSQTSHVVHIAVNSLLTVLAFVTQSAV